MPVTRLAGAIILAAAALALGCALAALSVSSAQPPAPRPCLFAFSSRIPGDGHLQRLKEVGSRLSVLAPNWYTLDLVNARATGGPDAEIRAVAAQHGVELWPVLNARARFAAFLTTSEQRRRLADAIAALATRERFDGITLDIEQIRPQERDGFTALVAAVGRRLHRAGRRLAVYVPRRTVAPPTRFASPYDWARLAGAADLVLASVYNEHHADGEPGPVTTTAGARAVLRYARGLTRWRRIAPVLGAFGYRWPASGASATLVSSADAESLAAAPGTRVQRIDGEATFASGSSRIWFETAAGLVSRARQVRHARMRWIALFSLGREPRGTVQRWGTRRRPGCRRSRPVAQRFRATV